MNGSRVAPGDAARKTRVLRWSVVALVVLALAMLGPSRGSAEAQKAAPVATDDFVVGEILVKFDPGTPRAEVAEAHAKNAGRVERTIPGIDVQAVSVGRGRERGAVAAYGRNPNVVFAEVNGVYRAADHGKPNDPQVDKQWQLNNAGQTGGTPSVDVDAFEAWHQTTGDAATAIAVLDSGIDQTHEDLRGRVTKSVNMTTVDPNDGHTSDTDGDRFGHGTHVAGSAAASRNNGVGVAGACGSCALHNVKVLDDSGGGNWEEIATGITWAADNGARVINLSLGGTSPTATVEQAVDYAWGKGAVVVAAAGNLGVSDPLYPAHYPNAIAVAATDHNDRKASFSNHGTSWVDIAAPGEAVLSTAIDDPATPEVERYRTASGTSMAASHAAGVAGLAWGASPGATNQTVRDVVEASADRIGGTGTLWSKGRLNACKAVGATCTRVSPTVDTSPPIATSPDESLVAASQLAAVSAPVELSWSGSDSGSGLDRCELEKSTDGGVYAGVALPSPTSTGDAVPLDPGHSYRFRVRAWDKAGNASDWAEGPSFALRAHQENGAGVTYPAGTWTSASVTSFYGGGVKYATASGARARLTFVGDDVAWVSTRNAGRGRAEVWVDGVKQTTLDLYSSTAQVRRVVFRKTFPTVGSHTLEVRPTGTKNASSSSTRVDVDAFLRIE